MTANRDLTSASHLLRNARADYADLIAAGVAHERALAQVGHTEESWKLVHAAELQQAGRDRRKHLASA